MADRLDESSEREVIVRDQRSGRVFFHRRAVSVIVGQPDDLQPRHVPLGFEPFQLGDEPVGPFLVGVVQIETAIPLVEMTLQRGDARLARVVGCLAVVDKFAVAAIADTRFTRAIPQVAFGGLCHRKIALTRIGIFGAPVVAVA